MGTKVVEHADRPVLLIVDDEEGPRESLRVVFKDRFQCLTAECGRAGIELAQCRPVDVAIIDIKMPDLSGTEVLRQIKEVDPTTECILLTGYETLETAREAVRYGASDYLNKPFDVFAIRALADKCLLRRKQKVAARESLAQLKTINEDLTNELARSQRAVTASVLTAGVIHQLSNPLSIIVGYSEILRADLMAMEDRPDLPASQIVDKLDLIVREVEQCKQIASRLLAFGRKSEGLSQVLDVAGVVRDTVALVRAHPEGREADVTGTVEEEALKILAWPTELLQALVNIGINGLQARRGRRGLLEISARSVLQVSPDCSYRSEEAKPESPHVEISFRDNGSGICEENLGRIFDPYFTTKTSGSGLGLAITREIVGRHRGLIDVQSKKGEGTTMRVFLPRA